ncbi:MAG: hypothetical protein LAT50_20275, partial [Ectothiorhodospiraceae bacterium]|nr:hypothetical protein [Ectothiorhodospiraceae bacterium]
MAISSGELDNRISDALKDAARNWALRQEGALDHAERVAPLLDGTPPPFRAASWLNTGLEATRTLFLDAALAGAAAARQASLPRAVASQAMERFQRAYRDETARVNAVMQGDYGAIKNQLKDNVREAANDV